MLSLAEALAALPPTADGIAAHLAQLGIRGVPGSACGCPLAVWLESLGMTGPRVSMHGIRATVQYAPTPAAVLLFVRRFDRGEYPALLLEAADV